MLLNTHEWLTKLIAFDTTSHHSNLPLIDTIHDWLKENHIASRLTYDPKEPKANLFATLPAYDGNTQGGIIFSGHTDTVPVEGQQWDSNPFEATERAGCIYGRGACDMKGFLAVLLALLPHFQQARLQKPLHFAFSYDEEIGCRGIPFLLADIEKWEIKPEGCIVGEPTSMRPVIAHKGRYLFRCKIHGFAAHSSLTNKGCNAIEHASQLIVYIRDFFKLRQSSGPFDKDFDVPFTTITSNMINGGNASNVIPEWCEFIFEIRNLPNDQPENIIKQIKDFCENNLLPNMRKEHPDASIAFENISSGMGLNTPEDATITKLVRKVTQIKDKIKVSYATEAGHFQRANIPTIICGPGSIEQAHKANEFVEIEQLKLCENFISQLVSYYVVK